MILQATPNPLHFDLSVRPICLDASCCAILKHGGIARKVLWSINAVTIE